MMSFIHQTNRLFVKIHIFLAPDICKEPIIVYKDFYNFFIQFHKITSKVLDVVKKIRDESNQKNKKNNGILFY